MPWNPIFPLGSVSVKANKAIGQDNTTYIETTMGNSIVGTNTSTTRDHFWNVGSDEDGRHRFIQSPAFTSTAVAPNDVYPAIGSGMDAVLFALTTNGRAEWFHRNASEIFQVTPSFKVGTRTVTSGGVTLTSVPPNVWGEIFMWRTTQGKNTGQTGFFRSDASTVEAWSLTLSPQGASDTVNLKFGNGSDVSGLNIQVRTSAASSGNLWQYRVMYRAI